MVTIATSKDLPLLPGYTFDYQNTLPADVDNQKKFFTKGQFFMKNGYAFDTSHTLYTNNKLQFEENAPSTPYDIGLTYHGQRVSNEFTTQFRPHYVTYDNQKLNFTGYFTQTVSGSPYETYRVRYVNLLYFLEDDTICVNEAHRPNSGFKQGKLVTRDKHVKPVANLYGRYYTWKDLNVGMDVHIYGVKYRLCTCDAFTKRFLVSQGLDLNPEESLPQDPYETRRLQSEHQVTSTTKRVVSYDRKLRHYLKYDGIKFSFRATLLPTTSGASTINDDILCDINFYLVDNTMEVLERHRPNNGRMPYPKILGRMRLPKDYRVLLKTSPGSLETEDHYFDQQASSDYYGPKDLLVGSTINVMNQKLFIFDCNEFTRQYYRDKFHIHQPERVPVEAELRGK
ncbi:hypothetical protein M8J76_014787 [Diaphorina citri]|nr:hypothetical protein M8J75_008808 [Diaphorina citri]KAI5722851.1 hypothetical protein M8J76_014787 [Diaphorina citri]